MIIKPMNKVIKSYALDTDTIEAIDRVSTDLGIKSRSETLRYIIKEFEKWQKEKQHNARG